MSEKTPLTADVIVGKIIPILGAILFTAGLGFLIYTSIWPSLNVEIRLGIGFFASFLLIGGGYSLTQKTKFFSDIIIGSGILLFYGTLIYGSRATELSQITIPEIATLLTATIVTIAIAYFASIRQSKTILILGMAGAYLLPFVIGQNDTWKSNMSFNAYLIYFAMVNASIFLLGREISAKEIIPLNTAGLFVGSLSIFHLIFKPVQEFDYVTGELIITQTPANTTLSVILLGIIVALTAASLVYSSRYFHEKSDDSLITFGYIAPFVWFLFHISGLQSVDDVNNFVKVIIYFGIAATYFGCWHYLRPLPNIRYQHIGAYAGGVMAIAYGISNIFGKDFNAFSGIGIALAGLVFAFWNMFAPNEKGERILTAILLTAIGGISGAFNILTDYGFGGMFDTILITIALLPALFLFPIAKMQKSIPKSVSDYITIHSLIALVMVIFVWITRLVDTFSSEFIFFILPGFLLIVFNFIKHFKGKPNNSANIGLGLMTFGFFPGFLYFIRMLIPNEANSVYFFTNNGILNQSDGENFLYAILAILGYAMYLKIQRKQFGENFAQKFFVPTTIFYAIILLVVNFLIVTICNDLGVPQTTGGIRAIGTTFWWILLSVSLIFAGIHNAIFRTEKLLGLILLFLTIAKIGIYDLSTMEMTNKIIVLMVVGGLMMMFSYFLYSKGYLTENSQTHSNNNQ